MTDYLKSQRETLRIANKCEALAAALIKDGHQMVASAQTEAISRKVENGHKDDQRKVSHYDTQIQAILQVQPRP